MILTPEFKQAVAAANGSPLRLVDPETGEAYLVFKEGPSGSPAPTLPVPAAPNKPPGPTEAELNEEIPLGIRMAYLAFRRDLPAMMADRKLKGKYVLYHRDKRIAVGKRGYELDEKAIKMGLPEDEFCTMWIGPEDEDLVPVTL